MSGNNMSENKTLINSVRLDLFYSVILSVVTLPILLYLRIDLINNEIISMFITFFGTMFGFTITALTILFMFNPMDNEILARIKKQGLYGQIFDRYISAIKVLLISSVILIIMVLFLDILIFEYVCLIPYITFIFLLVVFLSFLRIYRCVSLLADICNIL